MRKVSTEQIGKAVYDAITYIGCNTTPTAKQKLQQAYNYESGENAKFALKTILDNLDIAQKQNMPICQDTGMCFISLEIGQDVFLDGDYIGEVLNNYTVKAYKDNFYRKSTCDPLTRKNNGDNAPPIVYYDIVKGDKVTINVLLKGFGSENMSKIFMLRPSSSKEDIVNCIVNAVKEADSNPCPPIVLGIGIGGTFDKCAYLSKKALLRELGSHNDREDVSQLETEILNKVNDLGIGAMGFKGKTTCLAAHIEVMPTHIAGLPVAVNVQCHAIRCKKVVL